MSDSGYQPNDRRPIASRERRASQVIAGWLAGHRVSPNTISVLGMVAGMVAGVALWSTSAAPLTARIAWIVAAVLVQLRLLANMLDGMVAIASRKASPVGELFNEVPDRIADVAILIGLGYSAGGSPTAGYLAAVAAVFTAYVRATIKVAGGPQDYCGPMAKPHRMFVVTLCAVYLAVAPTAWQPAWQSWGLPAATLLVIFAGSLLTSMRRLARGAVFFTR